MSADSDATTPSSAPALKYPGNTHPCEYVSWYDQPAGGRSAPAAPAPTSVPESMTGSKGKHSQQGSVGDAKTTEKKKKGISPPASPVVHSQSPVERSTLRRFQSSKQGVSYQLQMPPDSANGTHSPQLAEPDPPDNTSCSTDKHSEPTSRPAVPLSATAGGTEVSPLSVCSLENNFARRQLVGDLPTDCSIQN